MAAFVEDDVQRRGRNRHRDVKRFCRGKEGVYHEPTVVVLRHYPDNELLADACARCGKRFGRSFRVWTKPIPDWWKALYRR